jgi:hypothetical protein
VNLPHNIQNPSKAEKLNILLPYYSRSGHTEKLALVLCAQLRALGHTVTLEKIVVAHNRSKWHLALPLLSTLPVLPLYLWVRPFRLWWLKRYPQVKQPIEPLAYPDVSQFDCICLGGPKWLYISYPVARYLQQVQGFADKPVAVFATFCGPPLEIFELEMLFTPLREHIHKAGGYMIAQLAISSHFHEFFFFHEMEYVFRLISRLRFGQPLRSFGIDQAWGQKEIANFCTHLSCNAPPLGQYPK